MKSAFSPGVAEGHALARQLAVNAYRGGSFSDLFDKVAEKLGKPVMLMETGCDAYNAHEKREDQLAQARIIHSNWIDLYRNTARNGGRGNCIGAVVFQWADEWWKKGQPFNLTVHDTEGSWHHEWYEHDAAAEKNMNEEWFGVCSIRREAIDGAHLIQPRAAYFALMDLWRHDPYTLGEAGLKALKLDEPKITEAAKVAAGATDSLLPKAEIPYWKPEKLELPVTVYSEGDGEEHGLRNWGNGEIARYTDRKENARVENGSLVIEAREEEYKGSRFTSARLKTQGLHRWTFGKFEARIKFPKGSDLQSTWRLLGSAYDWHNWPQCGQIDVATVTGAGKCNAVSGAMYWLKESVDPNWRNASWGGSTQLQSGSFADDYHTILLEWEDYELRWYLDNVRFHTALINRNEAEEFYKPFFMLLNLAVRADTFQEAEAVADEAMRFRIETFNNAEWVDLRVKKNGGQITGYRMKPIGGGVHEFTLPQLKVGDTLQWEYCYQDGVGSKQTGFNWKETFNGSTGSEDEVTRNRTSRKMYVDWVRVYRDKRIARATN